MTRRKRTTPHDARLERLRQRLADSKAEALLVTNPADIRYLTGFVGEDSWALVPLRSARRPVYILSDFRFDEQIRREAPRARVVMRKKESLAEALAKVRKRLRIDKVGFQPAHVTVATRKSLGKALGRGGLVETDDQLIKQRAVKDKPELDAIREALSIQQRAFREALEFAKPGQSEYEVCAYLEYRMRALGADGPSFPSIVAADANAALPHAIPGKAKLRRGGIVLFDWGARYNGYCSDMTRVIAFGRMKPKLREVYQVVLDAQLAAIDAIRPGAELKAVDGVARKLIRKAGYEKAFGHGLGHGIGLNIHEQPVLSFRAEGELEPGHVVTVEPGIYLPGVGGVRIEDDVLVTERGCRVLSDLPKGLDSAII